MKKLFKIVVGFVLSLLALMVLLLWLLHLGVFNAFILKKGILLAENNLNVSLKIDKLEGSIFKSIRFKQIEVVQSDTKILSMDELAIQYRLKQLLDHKIHINEILLENPKVVLYQKSDSSWNIQHIAVNKSQRDTSPPEKSWEIVIDKNHINDLNLNLRTIDTTLNLPARLKLNLHHSFQLTTGGMFVDIEKLNVSTQKPDFLIKRFSGKVFYGNDTLVWKNVDVQLDSTKLTTQGNMFFGKHMVVDAELNAKPLVLSDFKSFVNNMSLQGNPTFKASVKGNSEHMEGSVSLVDKQQRVEIDAVLNNLNQVPDYNVEVAVDSFDGFYWTQEKRFRSNLSGKISASGKGFNAQNSNFKINGLLKNISYDDYSAKALDIRATKKQEQLWGEIYAQAWFGNVQANFNLSHLFSVPDYSLTMDYEKINLEQILNDSAFNSNLNGKLEIKGQGFKTDSLTLHARLNNKESELFGYELQATDADIEYHKGKVKVNQLEVLSPLILITAQGSGDVKTSNNLNFYIEPRKIDTLMQQFGWPVIGAKGNIQGVLKGGVNDLNVKANFDLANLNYDSLKIEKAMGEADFTFASKKIDGQFTMETSVFDFQSYHAKKIKVKGYYSHDSIGAKADIVVTDSFNISLNAGLLTKASPEIILHQLELNYREQKWTAGSDSTSIKLLENSIVVNDFNLISSQQRLWINGKLSFEGEENLDVELTDVELWQLPISKYAGFSPSGKLSAQVNIRGSSSSPTVDFNADWVNPGYNKVKFSHFNAKAKYNKGRLQLNGKLDSEINRQVTLDADIPMHLSFSDSIWLDKNDASLHVKASIDSLPLETVDKFMPTNNLDMTGILNAEVGIEQSINNPLLNGFVEVPDANIKYPEYGLDYKNIKLRINLNQNAVKLKQLYAESGKGSMTISGKTQINDSFSGLTSDYTLTVNGENFEAINTHYLRAGISPNFTLSGKKTKSMANGRLKISSGYVNADYFTELFSGASESANPPLLVGADRKQDTMVYTDTAPKPPGNVSAQTNLKKLNGELNVVIPGNTWVEGKDINVELRGDIRLIFTNGKFDIFGNVSIKRGYYKLYGRRFSFNKGELNFTGSEEINPQLDFILLYKFRDLNREMRELTVLVNGTPKQPEFQFKLDSKVIEEKDAISYLLFGKSTQQLSENEQSSLASSGVLAKNLALNQLSSFLKGKIQETVGLDVVEIEGDSDWKRSSVTVGKYLTNNLYLEYEQGFAMDDSENILDTEKVMLEYQLIRSLFIKATNQSSNSGFDLIFKKSW